MHSVTRSPEPDFLAGLRSSLAQWDDLDGQIRRRIRDFLARDFQRICAYCERDCVPATRIGNSANEETIDHFRPRSQFPEQSLNWLNLVYACRRCNQVKADSWPSVGDELINRILAAEDDRYTPVSEYVNPNASAGRQPVREVFRFDVTSGEIAPSEELSYEDWSIARRTIRDVDLNDSMLGDNDPSNLRHLRRYRLYLMIEELIAASGDATSTNQIITESMSSHSPFSSYIAAYVNSPLFSP